MFIFLWTHINRTLAQYIRSSLMKYWVLDNSELFMEVGQFTKHFVCLISQIFVFRKVGISTKSKTSVYKFCVCPCFTKNSIEIITAWKIGICLVKKKKWILLHGKLPLHKYCQGLYILPKQFHLFPKNRANKEIIINKYWFHILSSYLLRTLMSTYVIRPNHFLMLWYLISLSFYFSVKYCFLLFSCCQTLWWIYYFNPCYLKFWPVQS